MEIAPITGIRSVSLFVPRRGRVEAGLPPFVVDEPARTDDEERSAQQEGEERGLDEDLTPEPEPEEAEEPRSESTGTGIDVTA